MSRLRVAALAAALVAVAAVPAAAQQADHSAHAAHGAKQQGKSVLTGELAEHFHGIDITPEVAAKIVEIQKTYHARMDALKKTPEGKTDAGKKKLALMMANEHKAFEALLTPAQVEKFRANMAEHHKSEKHDAKHDAKHGEKHDAKHDAKHPAKKGGHTGH